MAHSNSGFSEASDLLAAALEQMDGILASNYQVIQASYALVLCFVFFLVKNFCGDWYAKNLSRCSVVNGWVGSIIKA